MNELSPFEKLDLILSMMNNHDATYIQDLAKRLNNESEESYYEVKSILDKLYKDGYVSKTDTKAEYEIKESLRYLVDPIFYYKITFEGEYLIASEGYQELDRIANVRKNNERLLQSYPRILNVLTCWLALGTVGLLLIESIKLLNEIYHWWH